MSETEYTPELNVKQLSEAMSASHGTSLVTFYVQGDSDISPYISHLVKESSPTRNIQDKTVENSVRTALKSGIQLLRNYIDTVSHKSPANGFVLLAGEVEYCV